MTVSYGESRTKFIKVDGDSVFKSTPAKLTYFVLGTTNGVIKLALVNSKREGRL